MVAQSAKAAQEVQAMQHAEAMAMIRNLDHSLS
jgi:hypothetical protein